jgi:hypothetical protein
MNFNYTHTFHASWAGPITIGALVYFWFWEGSRTFWFGLIVVFSGMVFLFMLDRFFCFLWWFFAVFSAGFI